MMRKTLALFVAAVLLAGPAFAGNSAAGSSASGHSSGAVGGSRGGAGVGAKSGRSAAALAHISARGASHGAKHPDKIGSLQRRTAPLQVNLHRFTPCSQLSRETRDLSYCSAPAKMAFDDKVDTLVR